MEQSSRAVVGPLERTVRRVAGAWRAWRRRRYWTAERQLENLRNMVQGDHRWLAHDKVADALTARYLAALAPDWMSRVHAHPDHFRREIGLEPQHAFRVAEPAEVLARAQRLERGEPIYSDGPLPERGWDGPEPCKHRDEPRGCYRVRCQLGRKCVDA